MNFFKITSFIFQSDTLKRKQVKVFDIQHHAQINSGNCASISEMATSIDSSSSENISNCKQPNFSLVKLFMKQKSISTEGMFHSIIIFTITHTQDLKGRKEE